MSALVSWRPPFCRSPQMPTRFLATALRTARRCSDIRSNPTISERFHPSAGTGAFPHSTSTRTDHTCGYGLEHRHVKTGVEVLPDRHLDRGGPPFDPYRAACGGASHDGNDRGPN